MIDFVPASDLLRQLYLTAMGGRCKVRNFFACLGFRADFGDIWFDVRYFFRWTGFLWLPGSPQAWEALEIVVGLASLGGGRALSVWCSRERLDSLTDIALAECHLSSSFAYNDHTHLTLFV